MTSALASNDDGYDDAGQDDADDDAGGEDAGSAAVDDTTSSSYDDDDVMGGPIVGGCAGTRFGCCRDGKTYKQDAEGSDCDEFVESIGSVDSVASGSPVTVLIAIAAAGLLIGVAMYAYVRSRRSQTSTITKTQSEYVEGPYRQGRLQAVQDTRL
jgi:hypothetical protein